MVASPVIFQVVGYQNSGKTTVVNKLIKHLSEKGLKIATVKHHGHGGKPDLLETKDSSMHVSSGAVASIVEGDGRLVLQAEKANWSLEEHIAILKPLDPHIILIEGFKRADFPKVVLLKDPDSYHLLTLTNIKAVLYWGEKAKDIEDAHPLIPFYPIGDHTGEEWIVNFLINQYD